MIWSDEARVMVRPFRAYRALARDSQDGQWDARALAAKVAMLQLALGAFVSLTVAGRLVAAHVALTAIFWLFVPMWQLIAASLALRVVAPKVGRVRALGLYFVGHGPWLAFMLVVSGVCLFAPDVYAAMMKLLTSGALFALFGVAFLWGGVLTWSLFRNGLSLSRRRAAAATSIFYLVYVGAIVGYYLALDQILPNFFYRPAP